MELEVTRRARRLRIDNARQDHFYLHFTPDSVISGDEDTTVCEDGCWVPLIVPGEEVQLLPGEALPLLVFSESTRLLECTYTNALARENGMRAMVAVSGIEAGSLSKVGCLAEIVNFSLDSGQGVDRLLLFGRQRVELVQIADQYDFALIRFFDDTLTMLPREVAQGTSGLPAGACQGYDSHHTANALLDHLMNISGNFPHIARDPVLLSFEFCSWLPVSPQYRAEVLQSTSLAARLLRHLHFLRSFNGICCKSCGHTLIGSRSDLIPSPATYFVNPYGSIHGIVRLKSVDATVDDEPPNPEQSWIKGYAWQIVLCKSCNGHLGWKFTVWESRGQTEDPFFGLRTNVIHCSMSD